LQKIYFNMFDKIDTNSLFTHYCIKNSVLSDNIAEDLAQQLQVLLDANKNSMIFDFSQVNTIDQECVNIFADLYELVYSQNHSLIIYGLQAAVEQQLENYDLLEYFAPAETFAEAVAQVEADAAEMENDLEP
jgi:anti-anti-sigma regulatory factor